MTLIQRSNTFNQSWGYFDKSRIRRVSEWITEYTARGEFDKADEAIQTALDIHRSTEDRYRERMDLEALAKLQVRRVEVVAGRH